MPTNSDKHPLDHLNSRSFQTSNNPITSYSQNAEDIVINRVFSHQDKGFYVDIGAADPIINSVTYLFYLKGWRGINIEPQATFFERLKAIRPNDINLNIGVSSKKALLSFYQCHTVNEWSTFSKKQFHYLTKQGANFSKLKVSTNTLEQILDDHDTPHKFDFLKIDVEGYEEHVLKSNNWKKYHPSIVLIETENPLQIDRFMSAHGYLKALYDGINIFYVDREHSDYLSLLQKPANATDNYIPYQFMQLNEKLNLEFQSKESNLHKEFAIQYSLVDKELKKTQLEYQKLHKAYSQLIHHPQPSRQNLLQTLLKKIKKTPKEKIFTKEEIQEKITSVKNWYHQFEILPGLITPGVNDSSEVLKLLDLPEDCSGLSVLDIGARDGFFSFELEKRGAKVMALDYVPKNTTGFSVMAEILNSKNVHYVQDNIYNISPKKYGKFDIVLFLGLLYHLPDPIKALHIVRSVCSNKMYIETQGIENSFLLPNGQFTPLASISPILENIPLMQFYPKHTLNNDPSNYWAPNLICLNNMLEETSFKVVKSFVNGNRLIAHCQTDDYSDTENYLEMALGIKTPKLW
ncbi:FkbM family methyltransferase [Patescibacteria group bacterium]|nr:FkbM family methyltransferase [Patescibacteria group bacterium]